MPAVVVANPQLSVRLYKTIARSTLDGKTAVSARYQGKEEFIDLAPMLGEGSAVRTSKNVREPAGAFSLTFADMPSNGGVIGGLGGVSLESVYGLVEPMDMVEIRMWHGLGNRPAVLPIIMRGFVSDVQRSRSMGANGQPQNTVIVSGQDYGKIWQMYQIIYMAAYAEGKSMLTTYALNELFGIGAVNSMKAGEFVKAMVEKVINPYLKKFIPESSPMPKEIKTSEGILVKHGMVNLSSGGQQGSIYEILKNHTDVPTWNELYTEDREDGVHVVYRPIPALHITAENGTRKIMDDAPDPVYVPMPDSHVQTISTARSDGTVANFYWVNNSRFDLIDEAHRKLSAITADDGKVYIKEYPNSAVKYYGTRPMYAATQQGGDGVENQTSGLSKEEQEKRGVKQEAWIDKRRRQLVEMNRDNVVLERGSARVKGGPERQSGEAMKAGDYARFQLGRIESDAYCVQIDHEYLPFQHYTTNLTFERGEGFIKRMQMESGASSPWLAEQARRGGM